MENISHQKLELFTNHFTFFLLAEALKKLMDLVLTPQATGVEEGQEPSGTAAWNLWVFKQLKVQKGAGCISKLVGLVACYGFFVVGVFFERWWVFSLIFVLFGGLECSDDW